ncbi:bifunctional adenosylcobinamide kinase/adenosylcobinamide-phosphate guanylyltransferase [Pilimelia columellifera]|uniref:Adenosylcobinamide kinase n=1 Tax=Pilimelia columellifera subsp. columellifera TaxID=706583 RepID=A0ABN3NNV9_9ACTN
MPEDSWRTVLILGGIRSGKSAIAEALVSDAADLRYVATATTADAADDPEWRTRIAEHQRRRPESWLTEEVGADPATLTSVIASAGPGQTLLVDDLGGWVSSLLMADDTAAGAAEALAGALTTTAGRVVLVSPEVGLTLVATTAVGRRFTDLLGQVNQATAGVCDKVALVVAGQPLWIRGGPATPRSTAPVARTPAPTPAGLAAVSVATSHVAGDVFDHPVLAEDLAVPSVDDQAGIGALAKLAALPGAGLGALAEVVEFAAGTQGADPPLPWRRPRLLVVTGDHPGGAAAGAPAFDGRLSDAVVTLAAAAGVEIHTIAAPTGAAMERSPTLDLEQCQAAVAYGADLADQAIDDGVDLIVLGVAGAGGDAAATAVTGALAQVEPAAVLPRVVLAGGVIDDNAWMTRCEAVRDALRRSSGLAPEPFAVVAEYGGGPLATALGILLGAANRQTPVLVDGPVGMTAALAARNLSPSARRWFLVPDTGAGPLVRRLAELLGFPPLLTLGLDLGEGATSLAALPVLSAAVRVAATTDAGG